jgi:hypothetical protein
MKKELDRLKKMKRESESDAFKPKKSPIYAIKIIMKTLEI